MFKLRIATDNAAFDDRAQEIARILRGAAQGVEDGFLYGRPLFDINGNAVGKYDFTNARTIESDIQEDR